MLLAWRQIAVPPRAPRSAHPAEFSVERAMGHVRAIARAPHPTGSPELSRVRRYILDQIRSLRLAAETVTTTAVGTRYAEAGTVTNILTRLPGRDRDESAVLLVAHYDGVAAGPAAGDDGSGVAIMLETLRALAAGPPLAHDVMALFTDGEESGLLGAAAFAAQYPEAQRAGVVVNLEARGSSGRSLMFETSPGDLALVRAFAGADPDATGTSFLASLYRILPNDTDFSELSRIGLAGLNFAFIDDVLNYHTPRDAADQLDPASLAHQGEAALTLARHFGAAGPPAPSGLDATYFNFPLIGMVVYPSSWVRPLAVLAVLLLLGALVSGLTRGRFRARDPVLGLAGLLAAVVTAVVACLLVWLGLTRLHAGRENGGYPQWSALYLGAILLLTTTVTLAAARVFRRWIRPPGITMGSLVVWAGATIACVVVLPGGAYVFTWPVLLAALAVAIDALSPGRQFARVVSRASGALAGAIAVVFATTIAWLVLLGLGLTLPTVAAIAFLSVLVLWPITEWVAALSAPRWWVFPAVSGVASCALLALGQLTVRNDSHHPIRDIVVYSLDADSDRAQWYASGRRADAYTGQFLDNSQHRTVPSALELLSVALRGAGSGTLGAPAPALELTPPQARVVADSLHPDGRTLTLRVSSERGASELLLRIAGVPVRAASVNGQAISTQWRRGPSRDWRLAYVAPGPGGILLRLELGSAEPVPFEVADQSDGLPTIADRPGHERPPGTEPIQVPDVTLVLRRYKF
jgi:hypothetical protein